VVCFYSFSSSVTSYKCYVFATFFLVTVCFIVYLCFLYGELGILRVSLVSG
jgi:hypothetical protein